MIQRLTATASCLSLLAFGACATVADEPAAEVVLPPYQAPATLTEATEGASNVALFKVGDDDTTVYLMGTVHILQPDTSWKTPAYEAAFAASDAIFVEADTSTEATADLQPYVLSVGLNPQGTMLSSYFEDEERAALDAALTEIGVPMASLEPLRPWLAGVTLGVVGIQKLGGDPEAGVEKLIEADAAAAGKPVRFFETARQQIEIISGVSDQAWADSLVADLDEFSDFEGYFAELIGAWYDGRMDVVGDVMNDGMEAAPELGQALLYGRNADWAGQLETLIADEDGTFLVAVGAGHLAGQNTVQDYLEERGFTVERVN